LRGATIPATIAWRILNLKLVEMEPGIISLRRTFSHATFYYQLYGAAFLIALALCWIMVVSGYELGKPGVRDYSIRRCDLGANPNGPVLRILDAVNLEDLDTVNPWCQAAQISRHYGSVELRSVHRDHLDLRELYESRYDLVLAKPELMGGAGRAPKEGIGYELIAKYPDYGSQFVSLHGTPELSAAWMKGKTLGLLDDPNSVSAYQIPTAVLKNSGLEAEPKIVYFRSYRDLYQALFEGRVDMIASILSHEGPDSALQLPPGLILEQNIPGAGWYIRRELFQTPAHCEFLTTLEQLARNAPVDYIRDLQVVVPCHAD